MEGFMKKITKLIYTSTEHIIPQLVFLYVLLFLILRITNIELKPHQ